jgi:hypothetical protein
MTRRKTATPRKTTKTMRQLTMRPPLRRLPLRPMMRTRRTARVKVRRKRKRKRRKRRSSTRRRTMIRIRRPPADPYDVRSLAVLDRCLLSSSVIDTV